MRAYIVLLVFILASCTPQGRLARLLKHHPELQKHDTLWRNDTVVMASAHKDTVFRNTVTKDTVTIIKDHLTIKYFNSRDSVFISGKCDSIIKIVRVPTAISTIDLKERQTSAWDWIVRGLLLFCAGGMVCLAFVVIKIGKNKVL